MKRLLGVVVVLLVAGVAFGGSVYPLTEQERAAYGATHKVTYDYADLAAGTSSNTALVLSNFVVAAKMGVELRALVLERAFDTSNTNFTGSLALTVGDSTDADYYLTSTELASDGSEVFVKYGNVYQPGISAVATRVITNIVYENGAKTGNVTVVTSATQTSGTGAKVYTSADRVLFTLTPNVEEAVASNTVGRFSTYWRIWQAQ